MAFRPYTLWIDLEGNRLTLGAGSESTPKPLQFIQGDTAQIEIHALKRVDGVLVETSFPTGSTIKVGIGTREDNPISGTFALGYDSDITSDLVYNASASQIQTALNALPSVTSEGGVVVKAAGDGFIINWVSGVSHQQITANADGLFPKSFIRITPLDSQTEQSVFLHLTQSVIAYSTNWQLLPAAVSTIDDVVPWMDGSKVARLSISNEPSGGYINLVILSLPSVTTLGTITVPVSTTAADLRTQLRTKLTGSNDVIEVVKTDDFVWDITLGRNVLIGIVSESITSAKGLYGTMSFNTPEVHTFLAGDESKTSILEVNVLTTAGEQTVLQTPVTIFSDVIDSATLVPLVFEIPLGEQTANNRYVRRDTTQSISSLELNNIWLNLGVSKFGKDVSDAISNSDTPFSANPFVTASQLTGLALQSALDSLILTLDNYLTKDDNLGSLADPATARNNLGLGTMAVETASSYATTQFVTSQGYITSTALAGYATESWVTGRGYITSSALSGYATESFVTSRGYITSSALSGYATESWVTSSQSDFATESWVYSQGFIQSALSGYKDYINGFAEGTTTLSALDGFTGQMIDVSVSASNAIAKWDGWTVVFQIAAGRQLNEFDIATGKQIFVYLGDGSTTLQNWGTNVIEIDGSGSGVTIFIPNPSPYIGVSVLNGITIPLSLPLVTGSSVLYKEGTKSAFIEDLDSLISNEDYYYKTMVAVTKNELAAVRVATWTELSGKLDKTGGALTGKLTCPNRADAGINIGIGGASTSATTAGDLWIATGGSSLNYRDANGTWRVLPNTGSINTFTQPQVISTTATSTTPALRITNIATAGTGHSLLVEDDANPDSTSLVVTNTGNVGIGVATGYTATQKVEVVGNVKADGFVNGSGPVFTVKSVSTHGSGANTHDIFMSVNGSTYRIPAIFVSTP